MQRYVSSEGLNSQVCPAGSSCSPGSCLAGNLLTFWRGLGKLLGKAKRTNKEVMQRGRLFLTVFSLKFTCCAFTVVGSALGFGPIGRKLLFLILCQIPK